MKKYSLWNHLFHTYVGWSGSWVFDFRNHSVECSRSLQGKQWYSLGESNHDVESGEILIGRCLGRRTGTRTGRGRGRMDVRIY